MEINATTICDGCLEEIGHDAPRSCDHFRGLTLCAGCSPTYREMAENLSVFHDADGTVLTRAQCEAEVRQHLAGGGSLDDRIGLFTPEDDDD